MSGVPAVEVRAVSKRFAHSVRHALRYGLGDIFASATRRSSNGEALRAGEFWALRDVSFTLRRGESVGILGRNGAGKSTLLKLIAGIYAPTSGRIDVSGRVGAIIELGAAFAPNLTGRENIRPQAMLNGFDGAMLREKLDEIIDFADLGEFIDTPVQHYSTGMRARLGFAIAAHAAPEVLLIDEVLAVGDLSFQNKCLRYVEGFRERGGSVIFVGHSTHQMQAACDRGIILDGGAVRFEGSMVDALDSYMSPGDATPAARVAAPDVRPAAAPPAASTTFRVDRVSLESEGDILPAILFDVRLSEPIDAVRFVTAVVSQRGGVTLAAAVAEPLALGEGAHRVRMRLDHPPLLPGAYLLRLTVLGGANAYPLWTRGWEDAPLMVQVAGEATAEGNLLGAAGVHVRLDGTAECIAVEA